MIFEALGTVHTKCCATCTNWQPMPPSSFGYCEQRTPNDIIHGVKTTDLTLCSKWQEKKDAE